MIPKNYRAWDNKTKSIRDVLVIDWLNGLVDLEGGIIERDFKEIQLMHSTGLKDKNGVEIFEGDIVLVNVSNGFDHLVNEKAVVQESEFHSGLVCKSLISGMEYRIFSHQKMGYEYEVTGNIYENSELLEEQ